VFVAPSALGVGNWWSTALDSGRNRMVIVANETGTDRFWDTPVEYKAGQIFGPDLSQIEKAGRRTVISRVSELRRPSVT